MATKSTARTKGTGKTAKKPARTAPAKAAKTTARKRPSAAPSKRPSPSARAARPATASRNRATPQPSKARGRDFALDKMHQVALQAKNLDEAVNFYRNVLGLRFLTRLDPPGLAFFDMGGFRLMLSATASEATLYFRVADVGEAVKALKKRGVTFLHSPAMIQRDEAGELGKKGVEEWMAFFKDPSGNLLALTELR